MANRRMFSKSITNSSQFLMMPQSSQNLYFHLGMNADDDGFCEHFAIMRMTDSKPDDLKVLQAKGFVQVFDDKVLVIIDWKENNYLRSDRYTPSKYLEIYKEELKEIANPNQNVIFGIPEGYQRDTQDRIGKDRLGKERDIESEFNSLLEFKENNPNKTLLLEEKTKFISYWTEKSPNGKKCRWEMEKVFDIKRRWGTWLRNVESRMKPKEFKPHNDPTISQEQRNKNLERLGQMKGEILLRSDIKD